MMESAKALAATAAIRQMVQALLAGVQPKSTARQDALAELNIIPPHSPESCLGKIRSLSGWLDFLFSPEKSRKYGAKGSTRSRAKYLARIDAEIAQGLPDSVRASGRRERRE
jgi:hypothetical protein